MAVVDGALTYVGTSIPWVTSTDILQWTEVLIGFDRSTTTISDSTEYVGIMKYNPYAFAFGDTLLNAVADSQMS